MVALAVDDLPRSRKFYEDGLSLPAIESPPSVAFFKLNAVTRACLDISR